jgi:hypothetical protein
LRSHFFFGENFSVEGKIGRKLTSQTLRIFKGLRRIRYNSKVCQTPNPLVEKIRSAKEEQRMAKNKNCG